MYMQHTTKRRFGIVGITRISIRENIFVGIMYIHVNIVYYADAISTNSVARTLKKLRTSKGDYWIKQRFSSIASF